MMMLAMFVLGMLFCGLMRIESFVVKNILPLNSRKECQDGCDRDHQMCLNSTSNKALQQQCTPRLEACRRMCQFKRFSP